MKSSIFATGSGLISPATADGAIVGTPLPVDTLPGFVYWSRARVSSDASPENARTAKGEVITNPEDLSLPARRGTVHSNTQPLAAIAWLIASEFELIVLSSPNGEKRVGLAMAGPQ